MEQVATGVIVGLVETLMKNAPEVIDAIRGTKSNAEVLDAARAAAERIERAPASGAADDYLASLKGEST